MTQRVLAHDVNFAADGARLIVVAGPDKGRELTLTAAEHTLGTDEGCHLHLTDPTVSRRHAVIRVRERGASIHDLDSTNGTTVGGHRIANGYLSPGDVIGLGQTALSFEAAPPILADATDGAYGALLGRSAAMQELFAHIEKIARGNATVLIEGETGTGKELTAETIHTVSARAGQPFRVVDCAGVTPSLLETELFGHVRGAFTGAEESRPGAFEAANGGTVFLDEVGELLPSLQPKLLRVLENRVICRLGDARPRKLDVRIVAATNRDLAAEVKRGAFRADLYYRLAVVTVSVPPLRARREDIELLAEHFLSRRTGPPSPPLDSEMRKSLASHDWPGNVRELRAAVERWAVLGTAHRARAADDEGECATFRDAKSRAVHTWERSYLDRLMRNHRGNVSRAARAVKMSRNHLSELLRRHAGAREEP